VEQQTTVPTQAFLLAIFASAAAVACGHRCGLPNTVVLGLALLLCGGFGIAYRLRRHRDADRSALDRRAAWSAAAGIGLPLTVSVILWRSPGFDGLLLHSDAAAFAAVLVTTGFAAMPVSSMIDWFYVLPKALGLIGVPIWVDDAAGDTRGALGKDRRRRIAQVWVFHRGLCELIVLVSLALFLAIILVAVGNAFTDDKTLPAAIESLGGAGVAFAAVQYLTPRLEGALNFVLAAPVGLGMWVEGRDARGDAVRGLVVDVSIAPGIKVIDHEDERQRFIPLKEAPHVSPLPMPPEADDTWRQQTVHTFLAHDPRTAKEDGGPSWLRTPHVLRHAGRVLLIAFVACGVAAQLFDGGREPARHMVSELVHGRAGWVMTLGFACWAAALTVGVVALGLRAARDRLGLGATGIAVLLAVAALGVVTLTVFPTQTIAGELPAGVARTTTGRLHDLGSAVVMASLTAAVATSAVAWWRRGRREATVALALLTVAVGVTVAGLAIGPSVGGLRQRALLLAAIAWQWMLLGDATRRAAAR
jgi:hypothetical protein